MNAYTEPVEKSACHVVLPLFEEDSVVKTHRRAVGEEKKEEVAETPSGELLVHPPKVNRTQASLGRQTRL